MITSKKLIIGGGISGLVWKFYNPDYQIISPEVGGLFAKTHLVWLHDTVETRKLLTDLGWQNVDKSTKKSYTGYFYKGWISDNISNEINLVMIQKKMTDWNQPLETEFIPKTRDLSLSYPGGFNFMNVLDVDLEEVITRLRKNSNVFKGRVVEIGKNAVIIKPPEGDLIPVKYDHLVTTIPAPFFWSSWGTPKEFKYKPITNVLTKVRPSVFDDKYEMVYYDNSQLMTRVSHLGGLYAIEFTGVITEDEFKQNFPDLPIENYFVIQQGRIFETELNLPPSDNIIFLGRFAEWKYKITTEFVVKKTLDYKQLNK